MAYRKPEAVHEAGHIVVAIAMEFRVESVGFSGHLYVTKCEIDPYTTEPWKIAFMKQAGALAVEIQNEREKINDTTGYDGQDGMGSDREAIADIERYLKSRKLSDEDIRNLHEKRKNLVRSTLKKHWSVVEAIAFEIAGMIPSDSPISASEIEKIVQKADPKFFGENRKSFS